MPHLTKADRRLKVSANEGNRRRLLALAQIREIQLAKLRGELLDREEVKRLWGAHIEAVKNRLLILPGKLGPRVAITADPIECQELIRAEVYSALTELSEGKPAAKPAATTKPAGRGPHRTEASATKC